MVTRTFQDWNALGYRILKGSKAVAYNDDDMALFDESQVWHPERAAEEAKARKDARVFGGYDALGIWDDDEFDDPFYNDPWMFHD